MISGSDFTGGGGAVTQESLGKESDDPLNFVQQSYMDVFGRLPDQEGYDYFTSELNTGSLTPDSFIATLQGSSEAKERDVSGQGGTGLLYQKVDDYLAGGGQGGTPSDSAYIQDDDVPDVNTTEYTPNLYTTMDDGGNTTITQTSAGNNDAGVTTTGQSSTSNATDNWLQDFYTTTGINSGNLDAAAKTYWEGEAAKLGKDKVKDIIRGTARAEGTLA